MSAVDTVRAGSRDNSPAARRASATAPHPPPTAASSPRVFRLGFSSLGLAMAALFFAVSLQPSLLPRSGVVQGLASGVTMMIGYGLGAGLWAVLRYLGVPSPTGRTRTVLLAVAGVLLGLALILGIWRQVGWQNESREIFGMEPVSPTTWPVIALTTAVTAALVLIVSRSLRRLFGAVGRWLDRVLPRRAAIVLAAATLLLIIWLALTDVLVNGFFAGSNVIFSGRDVDTDPGIEQPASTLRSGGADSLVAWEDLGRQGRSFVATGPAVEQIDAVSGGGAKEPIRVYAGLKSAPTAQGRADLILAELRRTGAFEREALVLATTTGTGFLDPNGVDPVEYIHNGDTAIAGVQYSYLPSWISLLADQDAVQDASRVVFDTVHDYWSLLPRQQRPKLYLYGLSLGSFGVESVLTSPNILNEPIDGALMSGPPFVNPLHNQLESRRQSASPAWLPIVDEGRTVRFTAEDGGVERTRGPWGPNTRMLYLQHGSDPVVFFSPSLAWAAPDWLTDGRRAPDVSPSMNWFPVVTMWQVALDLPGAGGVPWGFGHLYSQRANAESWVAVTDPPRWSAESTDALVEALQAQPALGD